ncbi:Hypothetical protein GLP15_282 [Giardia lamblia P15]|uniref:Uncharacterized protein n=1 Tax=Giardia intestinalis (strain P15) TaxID=658858 RepID=E1EW41_GIAIA|nr:Hypothetical protein GLP15_282 [Giardia lamblia P15]
MPFSDTPSSWNSPFGSLLIELFSTASLKSTRWIIASINTLSYFSTLRLVIPAYTLIVYSLDDARPFTKFQKLIYYTVSFLLQVPSVTVRNAILTLFIVFLAISFPAIVILVIIKKNHGIVQHKYRLLVMWSICFTQICLAPYLLDQLFFYQAFTSFWKVVYLSMHVLTILIILCQEVFLNIFVLPMLQLNTEFLPTYPLADIAYGFTFICIHLLRSIVEPYPQLSAFMLALIMGCHLTLAANSPTLIGNTGLDLYFVGLITFVGSLAAIPTILFCFPFANYELALGVSIGLIFVVVTISVITFYIRLNIRLLKVFHEMKLISRVTLYLPYLYHNIFLRIRGLANTTTKLASIKIIQRLLGIHNFTFSHHSPTYNYKFTEQAFTRFRDTFMDTNILYSHGLIENEFDLAEGMSLPQEFKATNAPVTSINLTPNITANRSSPLASDITATTLDEEKWTMSKGTGSGASGGMGYDTDTNFIESPYLHTFTFNKHASISLSSHDNTTNSENETTSSYQRIEFTTVPGDFLVHHTFKNMYMYKVPRIFLPNYLSISELDVQGYVDSIRNFSIPTTYLPTAAAYILTSLSSVRSTCDLIETLSRKGMTLSKVTVRGSVYQNIIDMMVINKLQQYVMSLLQFSWLRDYTSNYTKIVLCTYMLNTISYSEETSCLSTTSGGQGDPVLDEMASMSLTDDAELDGDANEGKSPTNSASSQAINGNVNMDTFKDTTEDFRGPDSTHQFFKNKVIQKLREFIEDTLFVNNITDEANIRTDLNLPTLRRTDLEFSDNNLFLLYSFSTAMFALVYSNSSYYRNFFSYHMPDILHATEIPTSLGHEHTCLNQPNPVDAELFSTGSTTSDSSESHFEQAKSSPPVASSVLTHSLRNPKSVKKMVHIIYMRILRGSMGTMSSAALPWIRLCAFYKHCYEGLLINRESLLNFGRSSLHRSSSANHITDVLLLQLNYQLERIIFSMFLIHVFLFEIFKRTIFMVKNRPHFCKQGSHYIQYLTAYHRLLDCYQLLNTVDIAPRTNYFALFINKLVKRRLEMQCRVQLIKLSDVITKNEVYGVLKAIEELETKTSRQAHGNVEIPGQTFPFGASFTADKSASTGPGTINKDFPSSRSISKSGSYSKDDADFLPAELDYFSIHKEFQRKSKDVQHWFQAYEVVLSQLSHIYMGSELFTTSENLAYLIAQQFKLFSLLYEVSQLYYQFILFLISNFELEGVKEFQVFCKTNFYELLDSMMEGGAAKFDESTKHTKIATQWKPESNREEDATSCEEDDPTKQRGYAFLEENLRLMKMKDHIVTSTNSTSDPSAFSKLTNDLCFRKGMKVTHETPRLKVLYAELNSLHQFISPSQNHTICGRMLFKQASGFYKQATEHLFKIKMYAFMISAHIRLNKHKTNPFISSMFSTISHMYTDFDSVKVLRFLKIELAAYQAALKRCLKLYLTLFQEELDNPTILILLETLRYEFHLESLSFYLPMVNFKASMNSIKHRDFHNRTALENIYTYLLSFYSTDNIFEIYGPISKYNCSRVTPEYLSTLVHRIDYNSYFYNMLPYSWRKKHLIQYEQACALQILGAGYFTSEQFATNTIPPNSKAHNIHLSTFLLDYIMSDLNRKSFIEKKNVTRDLIINSLQFKNRAQNGMNTDVTARTDTPITPPLIAVAEVFRNTNARHIMHLIKRNGPDLDHYVGVLRNSAESLTSTCHLCRESLLGRCSIHKRIAVLMLKGNGTYAQLFNILKGKDNHKYPLTIHDFLFSDSTIASLNVYVNIPKVEPRRPKKRFRSSLDTLRNTENLELNSENQAMKPGRNIPLSKPTEQLAYERAEVATRLFDDSLFQVISISSKTNRIQRAQLRFIRICSDLAKTATKLLTTVKTKHEFNFYFEKIVTTFSGFRNSKYVSEIVCKLVLLSSNTGTIGMNIKTALYAIYQAINDISSKVYPCYFPVRFIRGPPALTPQLLPGAPGDVEDDALTETHTGKTRNNDVKPIGVFKGIDREAEFNLILRIRQEYAELGHFIAVFALVATLLILFFFTWYLTLVKQLSRYVPILKLMGQLMTLSYYRGLYSSVSALPNHVLPVSADDPVMEALLSVVKNSTEKYTLFDNIWIQPENNSVSYAFKKLDTRFYNRDYLLSIIGEQYEKYITKLTTALLDTTITTPTRSPSSGQFTESSTNTKQLNLLLSGFAPSNLATIKTAYVQLLLFMKLYLSHILSTLTIVFTVLFQLYIPVSHELEHIIDLSLAACPAYNVSSEFANVYSGVHEMNLTPKAYVSDPILLLSCPSLRYDSEGRYLTFAAHPFSDIAYSMQPRTLENTFLVNIVDYSLLESYVGTTQEDMEKRLDSRQYFRQFFHLNVPVFVSWSPTSDILINFGSGIIYALSGLYKKLDVTYYQDTEQNTYSLLNTITDSDGKSIFAKFVSELNCYQTEMHFQAISDKGLYKDALEQAQQPFLSNKLQYMYYSSLLDQDTVPSSITNTLTHEQKIGDILLSFFPGINNFMFYQTPLTSRDVDDYLALSLHNMAEQAIGFNPSLVVIPLLAQIVCTLFVCVYTMRLLYWLFKEDNNLRCILSNYLMNIIDNYGIGGLYDLDTNPVYKKNNILANHATMLFTMKQLLNGTNISLSSSNVSGDYARMQIQPELIPPTTGTATQLSNLSPYCSQSSHSILSVESEPLSQRVNLSVDDAMTDTVSFKLGAFSEDISACLQNEWRDFNEQTQDVLNCSRCKTVIRKQQCGWRFLIGILFFIFWISLAFLDDMRYINQRAYYNDKLRQTSYSYDLASVYALLLQRSSKAMSYVFFGASTTVSDWTELNNEIQFQIEAMITLYPESSSIILKLSEYNMELLNSELRAMGYTLAFMCPDGGFYSDLIQRTAEEHYFDQAFNELFTLYGRDYITESLAIKFTDKPPEDQWHKTLVSDAISDYFRTNNMSSYLSFNPEFNSCTAFFNSLQPPNTYAYKVVAEAIQMRIVMANIFCKKTIQSDTALGFVYTDCPKKFDKIDKQTIFQYMSALEYLAPIFDHYAEINKLTYEKASQVAIIKADRLLTATVLCVMLSSVICCDIFLTILLLRRVFHNFTLPQYIYGAISVFRWILEFIIFAFLIIDIQSLKNLIYTRAEPDMVMFMDTMQLYQNLLGDINTLTLLDLAISNRSQTRTSFVEFHSVLLSLNLSMPLFATEDIRIVPHTDVYTNIIADEGVQALLHTIASSTRYNPTNIERLLELVHYNSSRRLALYNIIYEYYYHVINSLLKSSVVSSMLPSTTESSLSYLPDADLRLNKMALGLHVHRLDDVKLALVYTYSSLSNAFDTYSAMIKDTITNAADRIGVKREHEEIYSIRTNGKRVIVTNASLASLDQMTEKRIHLRPPYIRIVAYIMAITVLLLMAFFMQSGPLIYYDTLGTPDLIIEGKRYLKPAFIVILSKSNNAYKVVSITEIPDADLYQYIRLTAEMRALVRNEIQRRISYGPENLITDRPDFTAILVYPNASDMAVAVDYCRTGPELSLHTNSKNILQEYLYKHCNEIKIYPAFIRILFPKHLCASCLDGLISEIVYLNDKGTSCSYHAIKHLQCSKMYLKHLPSAVQFLPTGFLHTDTKHMYKCRHAVPLYRCHECVENAEHEQQQDRSRAPSESQTAPNRDNEEEDPLDIRAVFEINKARLQSPFRFNLQAQKLKNVSRNVMTSLNKVCNIFSTTPLIFQYSIPTLLIYASMFLLVIFTIAFILTYSIIRLSSAGIDLQLYSMMAQFLYYFRRAIGSSFKHMVVLSQGHYGELTKDLLVHDINALSMLINVVSKKIEQMGNKEKIYDSIMESRPTFTQFIDCTYKIGNHVKASSPFYYDYITWLSSLGGALGELQNFLILLTNYNSRFSQQVITISLWVVIADVIILLTLRQILMWQLNKEVVKAGYIAKLIYK